MFRSRIFPLVLPVLLPALFSPAGCSPAGTDPATGEVVVYTALDRSFSEPIFHEFTRKTGIRVLAQYDTESTKTIGLANRIRAERNRPRCDVFWNNEPLNTLRLQKEGLLEPCSPPPEAARDYPEAFRDPEEFWFGFAARARVLIVNTRLVSQADTPRSIRDLAAPRWAGKTGIAKPLFGTTASHAACLFAALGEAEATEYFDALKRNRVKVLGGNKGCARAVAEGALAFALTDTDDALIEVEAGKPVRIVYPDSGAGQSGTLFLPNTLAVVKDAPHPREARKLVEFLLAPGVEKMLADGPSAQIPLSRKAGANPRVRGPGQIKAFDVDFRKAAAAFEAAARVIRERFLQ